MPLDLEQLPKGPHLIADFKPVLSGVDFLNLRQVNFDYMAECIPGINNVTMYVRPYSVVCWIYWTLQQKSESGEVKDLTNTQVINFRQKVQSLQLWGHRIHDLRGLPGMGADMPPDENGVRSLRFADWGGRNPKNTGLQAAVQYGPSLLDLGGLGFLHHETGEVYRVTPLGEKLAIGLDNQLQQSGDAYERLREIDMLAAHVNDAEALFPHWKVDGSSPEESAAFQEAAYCVLQLEKINTDLGKRSASIHLVRMILEQEGRPLGEQEIRDRMAFPSLWLRTGQTLQPSLLRQSRVWCLLQFRQIHRLALEALMGWLQNQLLDNLEMLAPDAIVDKAQELLIGELSIGNEATVKELLEAACPRFSDLDSFLSARESSASQFDPHRVCEDLLELANKDSMDLCAATLRALILLIQCRDWMRDDSEIQRFLDRGGATRVSMEHCFRTTERMMNRPNRDFIDWVIKSLVICQHFATGTNRFDGERIRLRFVLDENGLDPIGTDAWHPIVTADRLPTLLSLMSCSDMLEKQEGAFSLHQ